MVINKYKELIIVVIIIAIMVGITVYRYTNIEVTKEKEENIEVSTEKNEKIEVENTSASYTKEEIQLSMQKGEKFLKLGNIAIHSDDFDECLYITDLNKQTTKMLYKPENGIGKFYFDGEYVYLMPYYYRGKGIEKVDLNGNSTKIYEGASIQLWLQDDKIYFVDQIGYDQINGTPQGTLCVMNKDGSDKKEIIKNVKNYFYIVDETIYYVDQSTRSIYSANVDGTNKKEIAKGRCYITSATDKYLTYIDYNEQETQHIVFLDNMQNDSLGRFGNVFSSENDTYLYTMKTKADKITPEGGYTLFYIDTKNHKEVECWTQEDASLEYLYYVHNGYCYIRGGNGYYKINVEDKNDKKDLDLGYSYFVDGKAYSVKENKIEVKEIK